MEDPVDVSPHVTPTIILDGAEIPDDAKSQLVGTLVDTHVHLPDMFEVTFSDDEIPRLTSLAAIVGMVAEKRRGLG